MIERAKARPTITRLEIWRRPPSKALITSSSCYSNSRCLRSRCSHCSRCSRYSRSRSRSHPCLSPPFQPWRPTASFPQPTKSSQLCRLLFPPPVIQEYEARSFLRASDHPRQRCIRPSGTELGASLTRLVAAVKENVHLLPSTCSH